MYSKRYLVSKPLGLISPRSLTPVGLTPSAQEATTCGGPAADTAEGASNANAQTKRVRTGTDAGNQRHDSDPAKSDALRRRPIHPLLPRSPSQPAICQSSFPKKDRPRALPAPGPG